MPDRRSRKPLLVFLAVLGSGLLILGVSSFFAAERRLRNFCGDVQIGTQWPGLAMAAGTRGLKVEPPEGGRPAEVTDPATSDGTACTIEVGGDGRVTGKRYHSRG